MKIIDRAALVASGAVGHEPGLVDDPELIRQLGPGELSGDDWRKVVRAVLQAVREPGDDIEKAGGQEYAMTFQRPMMAEVNARAIWQAMIDAAIAEHQVEADAFGKWIKSYCGKFDPETMRFSANELRIAFDAGRNCPVKIGEVTVDLVIDEPIRGEYVDDATGMIKTTTLNIPNVTSPEQAQRLAEADRCTYGTITLADGRTFNVKLDERLP
jgi:hypothetical protein